MRSVWQWIAGQGGQHVVNQLGSLAAAACLGDDQAKVA